MYGYVLLPFPGFWKIGRGESLVMEAEKALTKLTRLGAPQIWLYEGNGTGESNAKFGNASEGMSGRQLREKISDTTFVKASCIPHDATHGLQVHAVFRL